MIYFTSDTHFGHTNIIEYCKRPFRDAFHMEVELINRWNARVGSADTVFVLGDFHLGSTMGFRNVIAMLRGQKMLVMGNHDRKTASFYRRNGFYDVFKQPIPMGFDGVGLMLSHQPMKDEDLKPGWVNLHGHVHEKWVRKGDHINVGVDVRDFEPKTFEELLR